MTDAQSPDEISHPGGNPVKLRLTALQADVLYWHLLETEEEIDGHYAPILQEIVDQLPEKDILSRPPSVETLIESGYFENCGDFDANVIEEPPQ